MINEDHDYPNIIRALCSACRLRSESIEEPSLFMNFLRKVVGLRVFRGDKMIYCRECRNLLTKRPEPPLKCSLCKNVYYCDKKCQTLDWMRHKGCECK